MGPRKKNILRLGVVLVLLVSALWLVLSTRSLEVEGRTFALVPPPRFDPSLVHALTPPAGAPAFDATSVPLHQTFAQGETLSGVLARFGVEGLEARELGAALANQVDLRRLRAGDPYAVYVDETGRLDAFQLAVADRGRLRLERNPKDSGWNKVWEPFERRGELRVITGVIESSLESAIRQAGGPGTLAYKMAGALQWDMDFTRDLRVGDRFEALYEHVWLDGQDRGPGKLIALRYHNQGRALEAFAFGEDGGYYDAEGRPLRKMFLRSPMRFSRVTSKFTHRRFHPVLKVYRPHYGVDYGAPTGTPVRVTAGGTVSFAGWNRGGGRTIKVRHPNDYESGYLHLSKFASGIRSGRRVTQGEIIGYVGSTGLATGPHLDYRIKHRGKYINPQQIKSVPAKQIAQKEMASYAAWRDTLRRSLDAGAPLSLDAGSSSQLASLRSVATTDLGQDPAAASAAR